MKKIKSYALTLFTAFLFTGIASCSSNEEENPTYNIYGTWECIETADNSYDYSIRPDRLFKFLNTEDYYADGMNWGQKCFIGTAEEGFRIDITTEDNRYYSYYTFDPTEKEWDDGGYTYHLDGNKLTIIEYDLDRWTGTITVEGDIMTFNYTYQNWIYGPNEIVSESKPYVSKLQRRR